jgi:hypothetical protein
MVKARRLIPPSPRRQDRPQLVAEVKEASVIRARAFNRALYARHLAVGIAAVLLLASVFELGRLTKAHPLPVKASQSQ